MSEAINDALAVQHPGDAYYRDAAWPIRFVEQRRLAIIRRMVGPSAGLSILEVGCGAGHILRLFPYARLTGVDISSEALAAAERNLGGYDATLIHGDVTGIDGSYDRVICSEVLEHVEDPNAMLATIARALAPGGLAVITVPNERVIQAVKAPLRPFMRVDWGGDDYHAHHWRPREFEIMLNAHLRIQERAFSPTRALAIRACYSCHAKP